MQNKGINEHYAYSAQFGVGAQNGGLLQSGYQGIQPNQYQESTLSAGVSSRPYTPIESIIQAINVELGDAHMSLSSLNDRLESVRAPAPTDGDCKTACAIAPSKFEQQLADVLNSIRALKDRINTTSAELRI